MQNIQTKNKFDEIIEKMITENINGIDDSLYNLENTEKISKVFKIVDSTGSFSKLDLSKKSKMHHLKSVITMLKDYVKVGEVKKKEVGEVMTPLELVKEMLTTLPEDVWSNPNLKWLDSCNGTGPFLVMVIYKLMIGLKDWESDEEKRYKHIVENMIYAGELQPKNMFLFVSAIDPFDEYNLNIYTGSFLEKEFDIHMKTVWGLEKFNIVVGNPPYQDVNEKGETKHGSGKLYPEFIKKSIHFLNKNGFLLFVNPNTWFSGSEQSSTGKLFYLFKEYNLIKLNTESDSTSLQKKYFDKVGTGELTYFLLENSKSYSKTEVNGQIFIDIGRYDFLPNILNSKTISILEKTLFMNNKKIDIVKDSGEYHSFKTTRNDNKLISSSNIEGYFKIVNSITKKAGIQFLYMPYKNFFQDRVKILISQSASFENMIIDNGEFGFTQNVTAIICKDMEEAIYIKEFLNLDIYKYLVNITKYGPAISPRMLSKLPFLPKNVDAYEYFQLSEDEISVIEN